VPEAERWLKARLYQRHMDTCPGWQRCQRDGLTFLQCRDRARQEKHTPVLSQMGREERDPAGYELRRDW